MAGNPEEELDVFTEEQREILKQRINVGVRGKDDERVGVGASAEISPLLSAFDIIDWLMEHG